MLFPAVSVVKYHDLAEFQGGLIHAVNFLVVN